MYADGFLNQRQRHPFAMSAAVAINLSAVAALMLAKNHYVPKQPDGPLTVESYPVPLPPPPNPDPPKPHSRTAPSAAPTPIPLRPVEPVDITPRTDIASTWGTGGGDIVIPPVKPTPTPTATPEPVLTGPVQIGSDLQPPYPPALQRQGIEGNVVLRILIGTDGRVKQVEIVSSDDAAFSDAAERQALRKWRFRPATLDGVAIESWKRLTVRFQLKG